MAKPGSRQDTVCSSPGQTPEQTPLPNTGKCDSGVVRTQRAAQTFPTQTHRRPLRPGCFGEEAPTSQRRRRGHSFTANAQSERTAKKKSPDVPSVHVIRCVLPFCRSAVLHGTLFVVAIVGLPTLGPSNWRSGSHQNAVLLDLQDSWM